MTALVAKALRLSTTDANFEALFQKRLHWSAEADAAIESRVADILADVQKRGDTAVLAYTQRFDGVTAQSMQQLVLTQAELKAAFDGLPSVQKEALQAAAKRVRTYHEAQKKSLWRKLVLPRRRWHFARPKSDAFRPRWHLCARWQSGLSFFRSHECHSCACGRC
jgi:hypothetical protein